MYYSITEATGTGSAVLLAVPPYLDKAHITVYIDGLATEAFTWINSQTISVIAPLNRLVRVVRRTSPGARLTQFLNGVPLPGQDLDVDSKQAFYLAQEAFDVAVAGGTMAPVQGGVELTTAGILALLNGQITPSQLELDLRSKIDLIDADGATVGSPAWLVAQEAAARAGAVQAAYDAAVTAVASEASNRTAAVVAEATAREDADGVLASQITTIAAVADGASAAVQEVASATADRLDGVEAQWTIKVQARSDGKQAIAGIGINAVSNTTVTQSEMVFLADKFTFVPSQADINVIPQPLLVAGLVNGINTLVVPSSRLGDQFVESRMVVDGLIEARHLNVSSRGCNLDPGFQLGAVGWTSFVARYVGAGAAPVPQSPVGYCAGFTDRDNFMSTLRLIPTSAGETFRVRCWVYNDGTMIRGVVAVWYDVDGAVIGGGGFSSTPVATAGWQLLDTVYTAPAGAVRASFAPWSNQGFGGTSVGYFAELLVERMTDSALVVAGGLSADRIDTRGITVKDAGGTVIFSASQKLGGAYIADAAIGTAHIANAAITSAQIGDLQVKSANIENLTVGTQKITAGALTSVVSGSSAGVARATITATSRVSTVGVGNINTSLNGDGKVLLWVNPAGWSTVQEWQINAFMLGECSMTLIPGEQFTFGFRIKRNGSTIWDVHSTAFAADASTGTRFCNAIMLADTPGPGVACAYTFEVYTSNTGASTNHAHSVVPLTYALMESKK